MDGYTVEEAASVLGVPRERVWELLARGIITGSADLGGAMRVRLKAEPATVPAAPPVDRPADPGYGASEATPFRELLTEFRSLTERYGQALLALGEARGEVAGLRSRVDMLEARVDLRLPSSAAPISSSWSSTPWPIPTERVVQPPPASPAVKTASAEEGTTGTAHDDAEPPATHEEEAGPHRRKPRAARRARERFADALARAEDPSLLELPGAEETAAALAALRQEHPPEATDAREAELPDRGADASLPRELPSADQVPVADEGRADSEVAAAAAAEVVPTEAARAAADVEADVEADLEPEPQPEPRAKVEPTPVAAAAAVVEESGAGEGDSGAEIAWDQERYSAAIEEPGWISAEEADAPAALSPPREAEAPAAPIPPREPEAPAALSPTAESEVPTDAAGAAGQPADGEADEPPAEPPAAWVRSSAEATRDTSTAIPIESSGSRELDEGLAALDALVNPQPVTDAGGDWLEREPQPIGATRPQAWVRPSPPPPLATRSSASRAYRRLRRIFPT
ncbi:MAG: hypothetical protein ABI841_02535 [Chloroflexota bacterium]